MKEIKMKQVGFEVKESGDFEIMYVPDQPTMLEAGKLYKFVFDPPHDYALIRKGKGES